MGKLALTALWAAILAAASIAAAEARDPVVDAISLSLGDAYRAVAGHDAEALGRLVAYSERRGLRGVRDRYASLERETRETCAAAPDLSRDCRERIGALRAELGEIERLRRELDRKREPLLAERLVLATIAFDQQLNEEVLAPRYQRVIRICGREKDPAACQGMHAQEVATLLDQADASRLMVRLAMLGATRVPASRDETRSVRRELDQVMARLGRRGSP